MTDSFAPKSDQSRSVPWLLLIALLCAGELLAISLLYQHNFVFTCRAAAPEAFCAFAGRIVPRALGVLAALGLFWLARRKTLLDTVPRTQGHSLTTGLWINLAGLALTLAPWTSLSDASNPGLVSLAALLWALGGTLMAAGLMRMLAPWAVWTTVLRDHGLVLLALVAVGLMLPELSDKLQPLWRSEWVTIVTFNAVWDVLTRMGYDVITDPAVKLIGNQDFAVLVGPQCSGVEGFALITVFLGLYMTLFRRDLRFPAVFLLIPIGLALSWAFNVVRIALLISIGFEGAPELAVGGFHSHAGWLAFTLLSISLIAVSRTIPFFSTTTRTQAQTPLKPFFSDPVVAQILPFAIFMATALLASTFFETPSLVYPFRAIIVAITLALFWPYLRRLPWRIDPWAVASGLVIGVLWLATSPDPGDAAPPFGTLTGGLLVLWMIARVLGTSLLVPILEELMFRGYIQGRIAPPGAPLWKLCLGIAVATALFALLHDRWIAAGLAGLVFSLLVVRSRNITDAILSHGLANLTIALWALTTGAWHVF